MKDHIFILLTSVNCFHCKGMRGNGMMGNKTFFMKPNTIESIFSKNDKIIFLNIHFGNENGSFDISHIESNEPFSFPKLYF